jgi:hypothetical protein
MTKTSRPLPQLAKALIFHGLPDHGWHFRPAPPCDLPSSEPCRSRQPKHVAITATDPPPKKLPCPSKTASTELHDLDPTDLIEGVTMVGGASLWQMSEEAKTTVTF